MQTITLNNAIKNFADLPPQILGGDEVVNIATDNGNLILISEESYKNLVLLSEVNANPEFKKSLLAGLHSPPDALVPESEVQW
jgi:PHD/YefM family antitoxin component YafN of YafNO toxin-antitoxin module